MQRLCRGCILNLPSAMENQEMETEIISMFNVCLLRSETGIALSPTPIIRILALSYDYNRVLI